MKNGRPAPASLTSLPLSFPLSLSLIRGGTATAAIRFGTAEGKGDKCIKRASARSFPPLKTSPRPRNNNEARTEGTGSDFSGCAFSVSRNLRIRARAPEINARPHAHRSPVSERFSHGATSESGCRALSLPVPRFPRIVFIYRICETDVCPVTEGDVRELSSRRTNAFVNYRVIVIIKLKICQGCIFKKR